MCSFYLKWQIAQFVHSLMLYSVSSSTEEKGVSEVFILSLHVFHISSEVGDVARFPQKCSSHTKDLRNIRTAMISQRYDTEEAEP